MSCCSFQTEAGPICTGSSPADPTCSNCVSLYCEVMSDTVGVLYRGYAPYYAWLTGKSVNRNDKWTENILKQQETSNLIRAGENPCDAAKQAACDVCTVECMNKAKPCDTSKLSLTTWILIIGAAAIVLIVGTNAFVNKEL